MGKATKLRQRSDNNPVPVRVDGTVHIKQQRRPPGPAYINVLKNEIRRWKMQARQYSEALATGIVSATQRAPMEDARKRLEELRSRRTNLEITAQKGRVAANQQRILEAQLVAARNTLAKSGNETSAEIGKIQEKRDKILRGLNVRYQRTPVQNEQARSVLRSEAENVRSMTTARLRSLSAESQVVQGNAESTIKRLTASIADIVQQKMAGETAARELQSVDAEIAQLQARLNSEKALLTPVAPVIPVVTRTQRPPRPRGKTLRGRIRKKTIG